MPAQPLRAQPRLMVTATAAVVACSLAVAAAALPLGALSQRAARDLLARDGYIQKVLEP